MRRRAPQRDAIMSYARDRRMRFHRILANHREFESFFNDLLGTAKLRVRIPFDELLAVTNVAAELSADAGDVVKLSAARNVGVQARRALCERAVYVGDTG